MIYGSAAGAEPYARPGGLVVASRNNYQGQGFKDVSAAGGSVLIYLDPMIDNAHGRYHDMLINQSVCGPATSRWPGSPKANSWGYLNDFRVGSVLQQKLPCVLEKMVAENPHMAGWFADDLGSRSWFSGFDWGSWGSANQQAYRSGAIALTETFRNVANRHGLIFLVNGTWTAGSVASNGGGYPDASKSGNALADGGFVEHHDGKIGHFGPYGCSPQWAAQSPVTKGRRSTTRSRTPLPGGTSTSNRTATPTSTTRPTTTPRHPGAAPPDRSPLPGDPVSQTAPPFTCSGPMSCLGRVITMGCPGFTASGGGT